MRLKFIKNKKRFFAIFCTVSALFFLMFGIVRLYAYRIAYAEKKLSGYDINIFNTGCVIKTFGRGSSSVNASVSFYTPTGTLIGSYERAWKGWELNIECIVFKFKKGCLVFPYRIFSDKTVGTGIVLFNMYTENNYPEIYKYSFFSEEEKQLITVLFKSAVFSPYLLSLFSSAQIKTVTLREFSPDSEYGLKILPSGEIILSKS